MFKHSMSMIYVSLSVCGALLVSVSANWLGVWLGLELSLLSFVPLISLSGSAFSGETSLKYFLVQAIASLMVVMSGVLSGVTLATSAILLISLTLKSGVAPLHFWFPQIMSGLGWSQMFFLMTLQKIGPLLIMSWISVDMSFILLAIGLISCMVGAYGGFNEMTISKLLAFSSIGHFGWIFSALTVSKDDAMIYFFSYAVILSTVVMVLAKTSVKHLNQVSPHGGYSMIVVMVLLLSMGGMPPLLGFFPKLSVVWALVAAGGVSQAIIMAGLSVVALYFYCRILFTLLTTSKWVAGWKHYNPSMMISLVHLLGGPVWVIGMGGV